MSNAYLGESVRKGMRGKGSLLKIMTMLKNVLGTTFIESKGEFEQVLSALYKTDWDLVKHLWNPPAEAE